MTIQPLCIDRINNGFPSKAWWLRLSKSWQLSPGASDAKSRPRPQAAAIDLSCADAFMRSRSEEVKIEC